MSEKTLVTGYALKEGHGHYYFRAVVDTSDDDCLDSIAERAYLAYRQGLKGGVPALDKVELELGSVDLKHLGQPILVRFCGETSEYFEAGRGNYPYDCPAKDRHPRSMIYQNYTKGTWIAEHDLVKRGDVYKLNWQQAIDTSLII